jgi:uncharacterized protein (TIGR03086 family)
MLDLQPATETLTGVIEGVRDDQLGAATPCRESSVADLLDHVDGFSRSFTEAANKTPPPGGSQPPSPDGSRLGADWRSRITDRLATLANAWGDPDAWTGMTEVGGLDLPGEVAGVIALDETIIHGWDLAVATGQSFSCEPQLLEAVYGFVASIVAQNPDGTPGLFGPPVPMPEDAALLDRILALSGRDPNWRPEAAHS